MMDRQLVSPLIITPLAPPTKLTASQTFNHLTAFLTLSQQSAAPSPARTQLERLADALGVEIGAIAPGEGERREHERLRERSERRAERKRRKEADERERLEGLIEGEGDDDKKDDGNDLKESEEKRDEDGMDEGAVDMDDDLKMDDRGDVEYGDVIDEDEDEPDNNDGMDQE